MQTKLIELRDRATFIPAIATLMESDHPQERYLLGRAGYRGTRCVLLARLSGGECHYDCYEWRYEPWRTAHEWLIDHWDEVKSGDVLDGEFLRGETTKRKISERFQDIGEYEASGVDAVIAAMERTAKGPHV